MTEKALRQNVKKGLSPYAHVISIENAVGVGTPDLNVCIGGYEIWIELKHFKEWPKRKTTNINLGSKNKASWQREMVWMQERIKHGGVCCVLVQNDKQYFLLNGSKVLDTKGIFTQEELFDINNVVLYASNAPLNYAGLVKALWRISIASVFPPLPDDIKKIVECQT